MRGDRVRCTDASRRQYVGWQTLDVFFQQKTAYESAEWDWRSDVCSSDLSGLSAVSVGFSASLACALPFAITARRLSYSGAAIAGWTGVRDIGKSSYVVITDSDVFPQGTVNISSIRVLEGSYSDKVISYTGSLIATSGSGLANPFIELIRKNGYSINRTENVEPHDGGGLTAMVNGETIMVGNTGFMNLMGIRVPQNINTP